MKTVCLVEDDASVRRALCRLLRVGGYNVTTFALPGECLDHWREHNNWGCLLLDMSMPGMSGVELQEELEARGCHIPLIFMTGQDEGIARIQALGAGAVGYLRKPFDETDLTRAINQALSLAHHRAS